MIDPRLTWFAMGATCSAVLFGWPWHQRRSISHENTKPPTGPPPLKPRRDIRSITFPDPSPDRQPTNPFTGDPVKPQPSGGRLITEGEWRAEWASIDDDGSFSLGLVRDHNPNPPPSDP